MAAEPLGWQEFTSTGSTTLTLPEGVALVEAVVLGGGGGGASYHPDRTQDGRGGSAGSWGSVSVADPVSVTVEVGRGGSAQTSDGRSGNAGSASHVTINGQATTGSGGSGGSGSSSISTARYGASPGSQTYFDTSFTGGGQNTGTSTPGNPPGGGGPGGDSGASSRRQGKAGGVGRVWVRFWIESKVLDFYLGGQVVDELYLGNLEVSSLHLGNHTVYGAV